MKTVLGFAVAVFGTATIVGWWVIQALRDFEHVADLGDMEWFDEIFDDYDWDDAYADEPGG